MVLARSNGESGRAKAPIWEIPLLIAVTLAPFFGGVFDPLPGLWLSSLIWLSALLSALTHGTAPRCPRAIVGLLAAPPILAAISCLTSTNRGATILATGLYASYTCAGWLGWNVVRSGGAVRLFGAILAGAFVVAGDGLAEYANWLKLGIHWRILSRFENPNCMAAYVATATVMLIGVAPHRVRWFGVISWTVVIAVFSATLSAAVFATGSRGGTAALAAGVIIAVSFAWRSGRLTERHGRAFLAVAVAGMLLGATWTGGMLQIRENVRAAPGVASAGSVPVTSNSSRFRLLTWLGAFRMGAARPLLGWGAGTFETAYSANARTAYTSHAHSTYLQLLAEQGVPGLAAYLALLLFAVRGLRRSWLDPQCWSGAAAGGLTTLVVHGIFEPLIRVPAVAFVLWIILGIALSREPSMDVWAPAETRGASRVWRMGTAVLALAGTVSLAIGLHYLSTSLRNAATRPLDAKASLAVAKCLLPMDARVAAAEASVLHAQGRQSEAVAAIRRAIELSPYDPGWRVAWGNMLRECGRSDEALKAYRGAVDCAPYEMDVLCLYAAALEEGHQRAEALGVYRRMLEIERSSDARLQPLDSHGPEYRFLRAHRAFIQEARRAGNGPELLLHEEMAAKLLSSRRLLFDTEPLSYHLEVAEEARLRREECGIWRDLAQAYSIRGRPADAYQARRNVEATLDSLSRLERLTTARDRHPHLSHDPVSSN